MAALAAQHLLPAERGDIDLVPRNVVGKDRAGRVGEGQALAGLRDPFAIGHAHAAGGAVPGEQHVVGEIDLRQIGQLAIVGAVQLGFEPQLLDRVGDPALAKAFPGQHRHAARAQHRPHRHFESAGVAAGDDPDPVRIGQLQHFAHQIDAIAQARLADLGAVRAAKAFGCQFFGGIARRLGAGTGRKERPGRLRLRLHSISHVDSPYREHARRWDRVARSRS